MSSELQQTMNAETASVWANEPTPECPKRGRNMFRWVAGFATLVTLVTLGGSGWLYLSGLRTFQAQVAQLTDSLGSREKPDVARFAGQTAQWVVRTTATSAGGGLILLLVVTLGGSAWRRSSLAHSARLAEDAGERIAKLQAQLATLTLSEEAVQKEKADIADRLTNLHRTQTQLEEELNQKRAVEKSLAQQTQQLERSKDVLEMHVQARTQELQKLQRRNELILNSAGECICGFDLQGRATFVNPAAARSAGWRIEDMLGKKEEDMFFPPRRGTGKGPGLLKDEKGNCLPEQVFHRKDGNTFPVEYNRTPIRENDRTVGTVVMFKDITERKLAEDKLTHKAAELARSNAELEQFAFVASHDLQEPLRKIQAFGDRLKVKCEAVQLEEGRDYLDRMQSAAARMQTLIKDLLTFSRVISASQPFVPVDLEQVTREVLVDLEVRIEKSCATVNMGKLPTIEADPLQMRQLLQNLIGNALKFQLPDAAPVVKIDAQMVTRDQIREDAVFPHPPPTVEPDDKFCVLTVQDNGIGFEEEYLEKIFAVFQRLHGRSEYEGTGVGLAVCRRITDRHGGLITAQSKPGEGSIFIAILPMRHPKPAAAAKPAAEAK